MNSQLAALDFITGCLGVRDTPDINDSLRSTIDSEDFNWQAVIKIANTQRVTPALWPALIKRGLVDSCPLGVREYLQQVHRLNTLRNLNLKAQAIEVTQQLNALGIEPILLKGGVSLFIKTFDDIGCRVMSDIDILVPSKAAEDCWNRLCSVGYVPIDNNHIDYTIHHHLKPLYCPSQCGRIEIHRDVVGRSSAHILPTSLVWENAEPVEEAGAKMSIPKPTYRILHNLVHSYVVNQLYVRGDSGLRSMHELMLIQSLYIQSLDWLTIRQFMDHCGKLKVLETWLYCAHRLFGIPLPDGIRQPFGAKIHYARIRLQIRWKWIQELIDRCMWFSASNICEHYQCNNDFSSLTRGRVQLAGQLTYKYSRQALEWVQHKVSGSPYRNKGF